MADDLIIRPPSKRENLLDLLMEHLGGIKPVNGYETDLNGAHYGRSIYGHETDVPFIAVLEAPKPAEYVAGGESTGKVRRNVTWELLLQGFAKNDPVEPLRPAYRMLAETELRLSELISEREGRPTHPSIYRLANQATDIMIGHGVVRPPADKVSPTAFFYLPLTVKYSYDLSKPYGE